MVNAPVEATTLLSIKDLSVYYGDSQALKRVSLDIRAKGITALMGPSGCGKSTLLRALNRMHALYDNIRVEGQAHLLSHQVDVLDEKHPPEWVRSTIGMVFQKPNPFPKTIYENVAYGPKIHGLFQKKSELDNIVEESLTKAGLWNEIKDRLHDQASALSGGQQQRLCIARTIAIEPEIILMDEPCSALDPIATAKIEELIDELKKNFTIIIVTHSMQHAARVSDMTAFFNMGKIVEYGTTDKIFTNPVNQQTQDYITGRFG